MPVLGMIGLIIGFLFFSPLVSDKSKQSRCSSYASGKITAVDTSVKRRRFRRVCYYIPTISFEVNKVPYRVKYLPSDDPHEYYVGDPFWVMYNPRNPDEISQDDDLLSIKSKIAAFVGFWIILLSILFLI